MAADRIFFDDLKGKGVDVVNEWLRGKGLEKLCGLFDTLECIINTFDAMQAVHRITDHQ